MRAIHTILLIGAALLSTESAASADTVQLKAGAILVGDVTLMEGGNAQIATRYPREATLKVTREDLMLRSLYDPLDRCADPGDSEAQPRAGELAELSGLFRTAIADYLAVADLRPDLAKEMTVRVHRVWEAVVGGILGEARRLLEDGNPRSALAYLHTLQDVYPGTEAAKRGAKEQMTAAHDHAGGATDVAEKTVPAEWAPKSIEGVQKNVENGHREMRKLEGHEGDSSRDRRAAEKAIKYFESAWEDVKTLPVTATDPDLQAQIRGLRKRVKERLAEAYLTAGSIHLQRYSIPRAEEFCNRACELEPEEKANHALHRLIIEAKINGGFGWPVSR